MRELTAEQSAALLIGRIADHLLNGGSVAWRRGTNPFCEIQHVWRDGDTLVVDGLARLQVHADRSLDTFSLYWWTDKPGVVPALMEARAC